MVFKIFMVTIPKMVLKVISLIITVRFLRIVTAVTILINQMCYRSEYRLTFILKHPVGFLMLLCFCL